MAEVFLVLAVLEKTKAESRVALSQHRAARH